MPTAASAYRRRGLATAGRGPVDPRDIIPNLHKKPSTAASKKRFPFLRKNSGGLAVGLLAVTPFLRKGSGGASVVSAIPHSSRRESLGDSRRNSLTDVFDEDTTIISRLASVKSGVKAKAKAFSSATNEVGAAFLANHRSNRRGSIDDTTVVSTSKSGGFSKSYHGASLLSLDMKRAAIQKSLSIKRSFTNSVNMAAKSTEEACVAAAPLSNLFSSFHHSYLSQLSTETPSNLEKSLGLQSKLRNAHPGRPIYNGHYVVVSPTPLKNPKLVIYSEELAKELGLKEEEVQSEVFLKYFSGDMEGVVGGESWATPYALSIMGRRYTNNVSYLFT
jgi:hypothetical protein